MRKTSRFISALLVVLMIFSLLPLSALAEETIVARIGEAEYSSLSDAIAAASEGQIVEIVKEGTYKLPNIPQNITVKADVEGVEINATGSGNICAIPNGVSFEGMTFNFGCENYHGFQHAGTINMKNCTLNGKFFSYGDMNFSECTFNAPGTADSGVSGKDYCMWTYGKDLTFDNCTFNGAGKFLNVYCEGNSNAYNISAKGCTFNSTETNKAAFNVKETSGSNVLNYNVVIEDCTTNENFPAAGEKGTLKVINSLVQVDDRILEGTENGGEITVSVDGEELYATQGNCVAKIGDTKYSSLSDAIAAASEGQTVEIVKEGTYKLPNIPKNITVKADVEGVVIDATGTGSICSIPNGVSFEGLTFNFGSSNYHGFQHAGTINMKNCTLNGKFFSYGDMNFSECTFNAPGTAASGVSGKDYCMWAYGKDLAFENCTFNGAGKFLNVYCESNDKAYNISAKGCTFNSTETNKAAFNVKETSGSNVLHYNVVIEDCTTSENFPVAGEKGTLKVINSLVQVDDRILEGTENGGEITVSVDGEELYATSAKAYAARIGDTKYDTLAAAVEAAENGDTVVLLSDSEGNGIKINKSITIDLGGYTYTVNGDLTGSTGTQTQAFQLLKDNNITIKNGKITSDKAKMLIQNYANLTLEDVVLDGSDLVGSPSYTVSNNNGNIAFLGDTEIIADEGGFAYDLYDWASAGYNGIKLKIADTVKIDGAVEIGGDRDVLDITVTASKDVLPEVPDNYIWKETETAGTYKLAICNHENTEIKDAKDATCTEAGYSGDTYCADCGELISKGEDITALGHEWDNGKVTTKASCTQAGVKTYTCATCKNTKTESIKMLGHNYKDGACTRCGAKDPNYKSPVKKNPFVDVKSGSFCYDPVLWAYYHAPQITAGVDKTHFAPNSDCTRAQIVTFLWRANGCPKPASTKCAFVDVDKNAFYYDAMLWAIGEGITKGVDKTHFAPNDTCTRAQAVTFLWRADNQPKPASTKCPFKDVTKGAFYYDAMLWAVGENITNGVDKTHFAPNNTCTRGQIVTFLYRDMI